MRVAARDSSCMSAAPLTIDLTAHAIRRFRDRVRPALDLDCAADELARLIGQAELTPEAPAWVEGFAYLYLVVGDVVLTLDPAFGDPERLVATTCLVRNGHPRRRRRRGGYRRPAFAQAA
jgi:hypothetical protein